jgi:membrane-associated protease RseP (regulator of RpoE activity)
VPTFVPSLITGITSTVTTFKTPPPNKTAMFDIAVAGPLLGILASLVAVAVGSSMTLTTDPSLLPALPLEILRQSTLGGGIINSILGNGALSIPEGAQGTAAVAGITIPLHPVAVAGYISLIVNALSLLPIGSTFTCSAWSDWPCE